MPDLNKHVLTPDSTEYLSPRIESNNVIDNGATLELGDLFTTDNASTQPTIYRNGNVISYIMGNVQATAAINVNEPIAFIPPSYATQVIQGLDMVYLVSASAGPDSIVVDYLDGKIALRYAGAGLANGDFLSLMGLVLLVK